MGYLFVKILLWLLGASMLGIAVGWFLRKMSSEMGKPSNGSWKLLEREHGALKREKVTALASIDALQENELKLKEALEDYDDLQKKLEVFDSLRKAKEDLEQDLKSAKEEIKGFFDMKREVESKDSQIDELKLSLASVELASKELASIKDLAKRLEKRNSQLIADLKRQKAAATQAVGFKNRISELEREISNLETTLGTRASSVHDEKLLGESVLSEHIDDGNRTEISSVEDAGSFTENTMAKSVQRRSSIEEIGGIGQELGAKFREMNIDFVDQLLERGKDPEGRSVLEFEFSFSPEQIVEWVKCADLFRIAAIDGQWAELLVASGIDSVQDLAGQNALQLAGKIRNIDHSGSRILQKAEASITELCSWIDDAKKLDKATTF